MKKYIKSVSYGYKSGDRYYGGLPAGTVKELPVSECDDVVVCSGISVTKPDSSKAVEEVRAAGSQV